MGEEPKFNSVKLIDVKDTIQDIDIPSLVKESTFKKIMGFIKKRDEETIR